MPGIFTVAFASRPRAVSTHSGAGTYGLPRLAPVTAELRGVETTTIGDRIWPEWMATSAGPIEATVGRRFAGPGNALWTAGVVGCWEVLQGHVRRP